LFYATFADVKSHEVIERAVEARGPKHVASELGVSLSLVYKWAEPVEKSGTINPLDRAAQLMNATDAPVLAQWLCEQAGGYFVKNPVATPVDSMRPRCRRRSPTACFRKTKRSAFAANGKT
jgi:hypothetical protein